MDLFNQLGGMLQQYAGASGDHSRTNEDFDMLAQNAPKSTLADGIQALFRSDQTPPFPQLLAQLFGQSNGSQRAGLLNMLLSAVGPMLLSQIMNKNGLSGLAGLLGSGQTQITPQQAEQIPSEAVYDIAAQAQEHNPSIIDTASDYFSNHPELLKSLGPSALSTALSHLSQSFGR